MAKKNQLTTSDYLEYSEYERLLQLLHDDKKYIWELYSRLSFCTACRVSDVLNLHWKDILDKDQVTVLEIKTGKLRSIKFNASVKKKTNELYRLLGSPSIEEHIFQTNRSKGAFTKQYINRKLKEFKSKYRINIGNFSTHTFRKTFGRYVYEANNRSEESLILLCKVLNHSSTAITKTYIGIRQDEIDNIFDSIKF
ncbi:tyrosine-type recombinase/integrase [Bacteroides sp. 224]|uniref:tyrosine-type recombinase/integrase n=1 Tax=Bacteroides sp. 224 TaxID=2302936 RepID=UPI0019402172|nr:tyrosine-type recombinase/integrase [Bacteroides sp. 224]